MTIGRTDDPENPLTPLAVEAAKLFGAGSRNPSGPADMMPRRKAEHMIAIDLPVRILTFPLASEGPSTHGVRTIVASQVCRSGAAGLSAVVQQGSRVNPDAPSRPRAGSQNGSGRSPPVLQRSLERPVRLGRNLIRP